MKYWFSDAARKEFSKAIEFYDRQRAGLGDEFYDDISGTIRRIIDDPSSYESAAAGTRCCRTHRFPYQIIYEIEPESIVIVAVMHLHRHPGYWRDRK